MTGGIVTVLALLGFLAVVVYVFIIKRREDFDEQARQPLEDQAEEQKDLENDLQSRSSDEGERQS